MEKKDITGDKLLEATSILMDGKIKDINFDVTQSYTISDASNNKQGEYLVTNGAIQLIAYSDRTDFEIGDEVYVLTPENNPENPRFIMGKKEKYENSYTTIDPYENFIEVEKIKILEGDNEVIGLVANDDDNLEYEIDTLEDLKITDYNSFGISADFQTMLPNVAFGNYGIKIELYYNTESQEEANITKSFDSAYMLGNPYFFDNFSTQKIVFSINNLIKSINRIVLTFYQSNNFTNKLGEEIFPINQNVIVEDSNFESNIKIKNLTLSFGYDISNIKDDYIQICCEEKASYKEENELKKLTLRWVHLKKDKTKTFIDSNTFSNTEDWELREFLDNCSIRWYKYNSQTSILNEDEYGGYHWEYIPTQKALTFDYSFTPSINLQQESLKVVIIKDDSDNSILSTEQKIIASDIITFNNEIKLMDQSIIDLIKGFNLKCEDNSLGNYFLYDLTNQIINYENSGKIRELKCYMDNIPITSVSKLEWKFPKNNTMLSFLVAENTDSYDIDNSSDSNYYILTAKNKNVENGYSIFYRIKSTYKENFYNNTVICSYWQNNTNVCQTNFEFRFGNGGTNGTSSTLVLENVYNKPLEDKDQNGYISSMAIQAILYNEQGEIEKNENILYNFSLYKPYNSNREDKITLIQTGNLCTITPIDETIINEINILQCKVEGYGDYNLIAYYPIAISNNSNNFITGPTQIIYNNAGKASYNSIPFQLYNEKGTIDCKWRIITEQIAQSEDFSLFIPKINNNELYVNNQFIQNCPLVAVQAYTMQNEKEVILFTQPILMLMNSWFSQVINEWDGKTLGINEEEGYILSKMLSAGKKNRNNQFSGVLLGDWSGTNSQDTITKNTGLYGFHEGIMSFYFKDDGTAAIGKAGKGQLQFNGNSGTIQSGLYQNSNGKNGALIDMVKGKIELTNEKNGKVILNASSETIFDQNDQNQLLNEKGEILYTDDEGKSYYYIIKKEDDNGNEIEEKIKSEPKQINGFPIIIGNENIDMENNAKFKVSWDGSVYATNGKFSGHINASSGSINGNFDVYGTLTGATIKSGKFIAGYNVKTNIVYEKINTFLDNQIYYIQQSDKSYKEVNIADEKDFNDYKNKKISLFKKTIEFEEDDDAYPIVFRSDMNNANSILGAIGLVPGKSSNDNTEGLGMISLNEDTPLIFDSGNANAKINSNVGIFLTLDENAAAGEANQQGTKPYINITNFNGGKLEFGNFNDEIYFNISPKKIIINCGPNNIQSLTDYIKELIKNTKPEEEEENSEKESLDSK